MTTNMNRDAFIPLPETRVLPKHGGRNDRKTAALIVLFFFAFVLSSFYPSDLTSYPRHKNAADTGPVTYLTENYLRFINTALQIGIPIFLGDKAGLVQLAYVGVTTTIATHGIKHLVNDWSVSGTRLGQRPSRIDSNNNVPSGHSSMASCGMYFVCRRYSLWFAVLLLPILLLTMYARVMLNDHTVSAVLSGAFLGMLTTAIFTTQWRTRSV